MIGGRAYISVPAGWQSGYAEDCKSSYSGSIPLPASSAPGHRPAGNPATASRIGRAAPYGSATFLKCFDSASPWRWYDEPMAPP